MRLENLEIVRSPHRPDKVRLIGKVSYDVLNCEPEFYWFEISDKYENFLSTSGNPWLVCLLPLAMTIGESLQIPNPVDSTLLKNVKELMGIWKCWYPELHMIDIKTELADRSLGDSPRNNAAFFSGGVDSFFTILRHNLKENFEDKIHIDDLLTVWGFDIPLSNVEAFDKMRARLESCASSLGKTFIDIATNLRNTQWKATKWGELSHGCALASVVLALEKKYSKALIASSHGYADLHPWGSHVLTDPLLSSSKTEIIHDSSAYKRIQKADLVSRSDIAMKSLHICWRSYSDINCGKCSKCYRTMMMLDLYGRLDDCKTFNKNDYMLSKISRVCVLGWNTQDNMLQIRELALKKGRLDMVRQVDLSMRRSARLNKYLSIAKSFESKRFFWRWAEPLKRLMLFNSLP